MKKGLGIVVAIVMLLNVCMCLAGGTASPIVKKNPVEQKLEIGKTMKVVVPPVTYKINDTSGKPNGKTISDYASAIYATYMGSCCVCEEEIWVNHNSEYKNVGKIPTAIGDYKGFMDNLVNYYSRKIKVKKKGGK